MQEYGEYAHCYELFCLFMNVERAVCILGIDSSIFSVCIGLYVSTSFSNFAFDFHELNLKVLSRPMVCLT